MCRYQHLRVTGWIITGTDVRFSWFVCLFGFTISVWMLEKEQWEPRKPVGWWQKGLADCVLPLFQLPFIVWQHFLPLCARKTQASWLLSDVLPLLSSRKLRRDGEKPHSNTFEYTHWALLVECLSPPNQISEEGLCLDAANWVLLKSIKTDVELLKVESAAKGPRPGQVLDPRSHLRL